MIRLSMPNLTPPQAVRFGAIDKKPDPVLSPAELRGLAKIHDGVVRSDRTSDEEKAGARNIAARYRKEADAQENG